MLYFLPVAQQATRDLAASLLRFLDHTNPVGLLRRSNQLVVESTHYTAHNKYKRPTSTPSAGFEHATSEIKRMLTYTSHPTATGMGYVVILLYYRLSFFSVF